MATPDTRHNSEDDKSGTKDEQIIREAMRRFDICANYESDARLRFIEDIKFCNGDADNMWQWDENTRNARGYGTIDERPCLTINKVRQHCLNIINDAKQNKPSVKIKPVGNGATYEAAQVFEGVCRHIEYISNAQAAYDRATTFQVQGGIGWVRLVTDYPDNNASFNDQEIYIRGVKDPLTVYLDPDIREPDGSDARYGFVFDDMSREVFKETYPKYKDLATKSPLDVSGDWLREDQVRVAEYFRVIEDEDTLIALQGPDGQVITRKSKLTDEQFKLAIDDPQTKRRQIIEKKVEWYLIAGDKIIERDTWAGKYIPLIRIVGEETIINGRMDRKGHTRAMKDPQRLANYWYSAATEHVALQSKTPYIGPMEAFSNLETYWDSANTVNHAWLPYNQYDEKGQKLEPPQRQAPPVMAEAYVKGLEIASQEIKEVSGQFQADLGMPSNEKSGVAIQQRQRQGDMATYHYIDNLALGIRFIGKQLIDLIPKIYDTKRVIKIMAEDGVEHDVVIDPNAQQALQKKQQETQFEVVQAIFNPTIGLYDVEADIGPAYATRRQEEFDALIKLMEKNEKLAQVAGDLLFKAADFPGAEEVARRIRATIPQNILNGQPGPSPQDAEMQKQMQAQGDMIQKLSQELAKAKLDKSIDQQQKEIDVYKAVTDRLAVTLPLITSPAEKANMAHEILMAEHASTTDMLGTTHQAILQSLASEQDHGQNMEAQAAQPEPANEGAAA
jgi:hypothetical protein